MHTDNPLPPAASSQLIGVMRDLSAAHDMEGVTAILRSAARTLTGADGVTFVLRDGEQCFYADEDAIAPLWKGRRFPLETCISGWVMLHGERAVIPDIYADARIPQEAYRPTFVKSLAMIPVRPHDPVAAMGAYWAEPHLATDAEVGVLTALADSAALALATLEERRARLALEHSVTAKDEFIAVMAHELRQPLHAATAALHLVRRRAQAPDHALDVLGRQVEQITRVVDDLLDATRIVRGEVALRRAPADLRDIIIGAIETAAPRLTERGHELAVTLPDHPVQVHADAARLRQVFVNLLANAAKYTPSGGRIRVSAATTTARAEVRVSDTGVGIRRDALPHIFTLFTRASEGTEQGLGVGLAVARRLVEEHGGTIAAHSDGPGRGSEFVVCLPAPDLLRA